MKQKPNCLTQPAWDGAVDLMKGVLELLGIDVNQAGLKDTPARFVAFLAEALDGPEPFEFTTFESETDEMVMVRNIPFASVCEHHLMPFLGVATIAYIPDKRQVGLSKIPRVLAKYASGPNNQERITSLVAEVLDGELKPLGVAVMLRAAHTCMEARGVKAHGAETVTSKMTGVFLTKPEARAEFFSLAK